MKDRGVLHLHAQESFHGEAYIVSDVTGLERLKDLIQRAIDQGHGTVVQDEFMPQDGECFGLYVIVDDSDWQSDSWKQRATPYTSEMASQPSDANTIYPWMDVLKKQD